MDEDEAPAHATTPRVSRDSHLNKKHRISRDCSSGSLTWKKQGTNTTRLSAKAPFQVFMADTREPTSDDRGIDDDPSSHRDTCSNSRSSDPKNTKQITVTLGEPGTIPRKEFKRQEHSNHKNDEPESSRRQISEAAREDQPTEKIYLSKEAIARVKDAVKRGKLLPEDATRDELRAYNKLASDITKKTRRMRLELEKQGKTITDLRPNRKALPEQPSDSSDHGSPSRGKSRFKNLRRTKKSRPQTGQRLQAQRRCRRKKILTPAKALITAQAYLYRA